MRAALLSLFTALTFVAAPAVELTIIYTGPTKGILQDCG